MGEEERDFFCVRCFLRMNNHRNPEGYGKDEEKGGGKREEGDDRRHLGLAVLLWPLMIPYPTFFPPPLISKSACSSFPPHRDLWAGFQFSVSVRSLACVSPREITWLATAFCQVRTSTQMHIRHYRTPSTLAIHINVYIDLMKDIPTHTHTNMHNAPAWTHLDCGCARLLTF